MGVRHFALWKKGTQPTFPPHVKEPTVGADITVAAPRKPTGSPESVFEPAWQGAEQAGVGLQLSSPALLSLCCLFSREGWHRT